MRDVILLLSAKLRQARNTVRDPRARVKSLFLALLAGCFCLVVYFASYYILGYIKDIYVGPGLELMELRFEINRRLLGMAVLTFMAVLLFSNVITALGSFFMSEDLELVGALPVSTDAMFASRFLEMMVDSSWMIVVFGTPVFVAFGAVYAAGGWYYASIPAVMVPFILIPAGIGTVVTMALVSAFPARRIRDILFLLSVLAAGMLFLLLRLMQPEKLVNPDTQLEVFEFIQTLQAPIKAWMPNFWVTEILSRMVRGGLGTPGWIYMALLWTSGLGTAAVAMLFVRAFYRESFSKSQEATRTFISRTSMANRIISLLARPFSPALKQMVMKDTRVFMRDTSQWSQVFLLAALVIIYVFNFRAMPLSRLPLDQFKIQNVVSYMNIGLAGFVMTALAARFVFPMVSLEGHAFWIVKSSPLSLRGFLWSKFLISALPLVVIGEILIVVTNHLLEVSAVVWVVSVVTIFGMTFAVCGMGVGLGARFPNFRAENPAKVATSFGGVVYMILTMFVIGAVVVIEAWPTYVYFVASMKGYRITVQQAAWIGMSYLVVILIFVAAALLPMRAGLRHIERMELA